MVQILLFALQLKMQTYLRAHVNAGLRPQRYANIYQQPFQLRFATHKPAGFTRQVHARPQTRASAEPAALAKAQTRHTFSGRGLLGVGAGTIAAVGLHLTLQPKVYCERKLGVDIYVHGFRTIRLKVSPPS